MDMNFQSTCVYLNNGKQNSYIKNFQNLLINILPLNEVFRLNQENLLNSKQ